MQWVCPLHTLIHAAMHMAQARCLCPFLGQYTQSGQGSSFCSLFHPRSCCSPHELHTGTHAEERLSSIPWQRTNGGCLRRACCRLTKAARAHPPTSTRRTNAPHHHDSRPHFASLHPILPNSPAVHSPQRSFYHRHALRRPCCRACLRKHTQARTRANRDRLPSSHANQPML